MAFFRLFGHKGCPLSWIFWSIIPRERACVDRFLQEYQKNVGLPGMIGDIEVRSLSEETVYFGGTEKE